MPCGHAFEPATLVALGRSVLDDGKTEVRCSVPDPTNVKHHCNCVFPYELIRKLLTKAGKKEFEMKYTKNYLREEGKVRNCPTCHAPLDRGDSQEVCITDFLLSNKLSCDTNFFSRVARALVLQRKNTGFKSQTRRHFLDIFFCLIPFVSTLLFLHFQNKSFHLCHFKSINASGLRFTNNNANKV